MIELSTLGVAILAALFVLLVHWGVVLFLAVFLYLVSRR